MTTYAAIANGDVDLDSPGSQTLFTALRDNPIAIAEGSTGAPVNQWGWHPYDMVAVGDGATGKFYDFSVDGAVATVASPTFADGYEYAFHGISMTCSAGASVQLQAEFYRATSAAYSSPAPFGTLASFGTLRWFYLEIHRPRIATLRGMGTATTGNGTGVSGAMSAVTAYLTTSQKVGNIRFSYTSGNIAGGKIYMVRRRVEV